MIRFSVLLVITVFAGKKKVASSEVMKTASEAAMSMSIATISNLAAASKAAAFAAKKKAASPEMMKAAAEAVAIKVKEEKLLEKPVKMVNYRDKLEAIKQIVKEERMKAAAETQATKVKEEKLFEKPVKMVDYRSKLEAIKEKVKIEAAKPEAAKKAGKKADKGKPLPKPVGNRGKCTF